MNRVPVSHVVLSWTLLSVGLCAQDIAVLDLTAPEIRQRFETQTTACGGLARDTQTSARDLPLDLRIELLDRKDYRRGDEIVSEIRFTNSGAKPISLPWSPDQETVYGKDCEWLPKLSQGAGLQGRLSLEFADEAGYTAYIASHDLYGNSSNPATFRLLAPHESVRIKMGGRVCLQNMIDKRREKGLQFKLPQEFLVTASFDLDDGSLTTPYKKLRSTSQVMVRVKEK